MSYPVLKHTVVDTWWTKWKNSGSTSLPQTLEPEFMQRGSDEIEWLDIAKELTKYLEHLYDQVDGIQEGQRVGMSTSQFEAEASVYVHEVLPKDSALEDPEFWIWLSAGPGAPLIRRRYPPSHRNQIPGRQNFTSRSARETLFYRLWIRANRSVEISGPHAPYEFALYGDVDFWRSHVFRQKFNAVNAILLEFIKFQYPNGPEGEKKMEDKEIRALVKQIRRSIANLIPEVLSYGDARQFIGAQWQKII